MNCEEAKSLLTKYLLGDLDEAQASAVRAHLKKCDICSAEAAEIQPTLDLLREALSDTEPAPARLDVDRHGLIYAEEPRGMGRIIDFVSRDYPAVRRLASVLVICLLIGLLAAISIPSFVKARHTAKSSASINSLRMVDAAIEMYKADNAGAAPASVSDISGYMKEGKVVGPLSGEELTYDFSVYGNGVGIVAVDKGAEGSAVLYGDGRIEYEKASKEKDGLFASRNKQEAYAVPKGSGNSTVLSVQMARPKRKRNADSSETVTYGVPDLSDVDVDGAMDEATTVTYAGKAGKMGKGSSSGAVGGWVGDQLPEVEEVAPADVPAIEPSPVVEPPPGQTEEAASGPIPQPASLDGVPATKSPAIVRGVEHRRQSAVGIEALERKPAPAEPAMPASAPVVTATMPAEEVGLAGDVVNGIAPSYTYSGSAAAAGGAAEDAKQSGEKTRVASGRGKIAVIHGGGAGSADGDADARILQGKEALKQRKLVEASELELSLGSKGFSGESEIGGRAAKKEDVSLREAEGLPADTRAAADRFYVSEPESRARKEAAAKDTLTEQKARENTRTDAVADDSIAEAPAWNEADEGRDKSFAEKIPLIGGLFKRSEAPAKPVAAAPTPAVVTTDEGVPVEVAKDLQVVEEDAEVALSEKSMPAPEAKKEANKGEEDGKTGQDVPDAGRLVNGPADAPLPGQQVDKLIVDERKAPEAPKPDDEDKTGTRFIAYGVNPVINVSENSFSTFSIDVDTASYTLTRNYIIGGQLPPAESVRTEEIVNFFDYAYKAPEQMTFAVYAEAAPSKFGRGQHLLKIGVKGKRIGREEERPAVLTFLIDTSGSMEKPDRIGLVKKSLRMLVEKLSDNDRVSIIQYDSRARLVLAHTPAKERQKIIETIDGLQCSGSTDLEQGIDKAYETAARGFVSKGENRVLILSDGVANLGSLDAETMLAKVEKYRKQGIYCSVFGLGMGTYDDVMLETLANRGDGTYAYLDSEEEAKRLFVDDLSATLNTIAKDVKIQVEFNRNLVKTFRQLGYENRQLTKEQFRDDTVDAGEVGSGQSVTALYELEMIKAVSKRLGPEPAATVRVRYRRTDNDAVEEIEVPVTFKDFVNDFNQADARFRLAACAAEFAEILRGSPYAQGSEYSDVSAALRPVALELNLDQRVQEFLRLTTSAPGMARGQ